MKMGKIAVAGRYDSLAGVAAWNIQIFAPLAGAVSLIACGHTGARRNLRLGEASHTANRVSSRSASRGLLLKPSHPRGWTQGRVFREHLIFQRSDEIVATAMALLEPPRSARPGPDCVEPCWGHIGVLRCDHQATKDGNSALVKKIWIVRTGGSVPRF